MLTGAAISMERPEFLLLSLLTIPAILFVVRKYFKIRKSLKSSDFETSENLSKLKKSLIVKTLFRCFSLIFISLALSEIKFGTRKYPVQKSGTNVNFVFDISYSMMAKDAPKNYSRLQAVKEYASALISEMEGISCSLTLAKGDGFTAIPETEDRAIVYSLIESLSPKIMSSAGSSLGKGIDSALKSIPAHSAKSQFIFVFTDGDETDRQLEKSLLRAAKYGVPVFLVGFGSEKEIEITAGDGKTKVKTAMQKKKMEEMAEKINSENYSPLSSKKGKAVSFVDSKAKGSAWTLLSKIKKTSNPRPKDDLEFSDATISYEIKNVNRHSFFILLSLVTFILSFILAEASFEKIKFKSLIKKISLSSLVFFFISCSSEKKQMLDGVWNWYEGNFSAATADFLNVDHNNPRGSLARQYASYNLAATYISLGEDEAALERLSQISLDDENLPAQLKSAALYNLGIIFTHKNDLSSAKNYFREAVLANSSNQQARINLELCERALSQQKAQSASAQMQGVNEEKNDQNSEMKNEIFNLIRENEDKRWKNMKSSSEDSGQIDY